jgi:hypothetical protein
MALPLVAKQDIRRGCRKLISKPPSKLQLLHRFGIEIRPGTAGSLTGQRAAGIRRR